MYTMQSDRLKVNVSGPGEAPNTTVRFDRAGFIEEVVLDGLHRFCASEPYNLSHVSSGGRGICSEFKAAGDAEAPVGGEFLKPGIGVMHKEAEGPYRFMNKYKYAPLKIEVSQAGDALKFITQPAECGGYSLRHEKLLRVTDNRLDMEMKLTNTGEKKYIGDEYCHNFLTINSMSLGPNYSLEFPSGKDRGDGPPESDFYAKGKGFTFTKMPERARMFIMDAAEFSTAPGGDLEWIFSNAAERARVHAYEKINLSKVALWTVDHMLSTESFHSIEIAPGETSSWSRSWVFETF